MYQDDLHRIFEIINHNLIPTCKVGFHSHNNMQMSNALSQEFIRMTYGKKERLWLMEQFLEWEEELEILRRN